MNSSLAHQAKRTISSKKDDDKQAENGGRDCEVEATIIVKLARHFASTNPRRQWHCLRPSLSRKGT